MLRRIEMPMTAAGKNLVLSEEVEKNALVLYQDTKDGLIFAGLYDPDVPDEGYCDGIVAVPLRSAFHDVVTFSEGKQVWNVEGSSTDKTYVDDDGNIHRNVIWKNIWSEVTGDPFNNVCYVKGIWKSIYVKVLHFNDIIILEDITEFSYIISLSASLTFLKSNFNKQKHPYKYNS
mgnify:CR=1 FL=1